VEGEHDLALARVAGLLPGSPVGAEQRAHHRAGQRDRHDRIAHPAGEGEGVRSVLRGNIEFRARLLGRPRQRCRVFDRVETAAMGHVLACQEQFDLFDALAEARHRFIWRTAEAAKLVRQKGAREADIEPTLADCVQHANFAREL
jgi:hypothetical protein